MRSAAKLIPAVVFSAVLLSSLVLSAIPSSAEQSRFAPLNSEYVEYQQQLKVYKDSATALLAMGSSPGERPPGVIPSPVDLSYIKAPSGRRRVMTSSLLPCRWDMREKWMTTPARDQGACGSCWAFASLGSLESNLLPWDPLGSSLDLSENSVIYTGTEGCCAGGSAGRVATYLARWSGAVSETDDPYILDPETLLPDCTSNQEAPLFRKVSEVLYLPDIF